MNYPLPFPDFDMFTVTVDLTRDGLPHHREVIEIIFQYMNILRKVGAQEWIFRECQKLAGIAFQFKEKSAPSGYTCKRMGLDGSRESS